MSIFKGFDEIIDDTERENAIDTFHYICDQDGIVDAIDRAELRTDIVNGYCKQSNYNDQSPCDVDIYNY